jgi:hypothetical protein
MQCSQAQIGLNVIKEELRHIKKSPTVGRGGSDEARMEQLRALLKTQIDDLVLAECDKVIFWGEKIFEHQDGVRKAIKIYLQQQENISIDMAGIHRQLIRIADEMKRSRS